MPLNEETPTTAKIDAASAKLHKNRASTSKSSSSETSETESTGNKKSRLGLLQRVFSGESAKSSERGKTRALERHEEEEGDDGELEVWFAGCHSGW